MKTLCSFKWPGRFLICVALACSSCALTAQDSFMDDEEDQRGLDEAYEGLRSDYVEKIKEPGFEQNYGKLRAYATEKERLMNVYSRALNDLRFELDDPEDTLRRSQVLKVLFNSEKSGKTDSASYVQFMEMHGYRRVVQNQRSATPSSWAVYRVRKIDNPGMEPSYEHTLDCSIDGMLRTKDKLENLQRAWQAEYKRYGALKKSLLVVEKDHETCLNQLDSAMDPKRQEQAFKSDVSLIFAGLLAIVLIAFFALVFFRGKDLSEYLLNDNGLQFITLFALIIAIVLFGILGILEGSELAAILSGISGFILGKTNLKAPGRATSSTISAQDSQA